MTKYLQATFLASTFYFSTLSFADTPDCMQTKFLAQQAFTMIQGGASLNKTLRAFEQTDFNNYVIKKIYNNKNIIRNVSNAQKSAIKSCRNYT